MLESTSNGLEPGIRFCFKVMKMEILIFLNSCYRWYSSIWIASKWFLEWFWARKMDLLVQLLENGSLCVKFHFHENLKGVFELWCFWAYEYDPNSSGNLFRMCLSAHLMVLAMISRNGLFSACLQKWWNLQLQICFGLEVLYLWWFVHFQNNI